MIIDVIFAFICVFFVVYLISLQLIFLNILGLINSVIFLRSFFSIRK